MGLGNPITYEFRLQFCLSTLNCFFIINKISLSSLQGKSLHGGVRWGLGAQLPQPCCDFYPRIKISLFLDSAQVGLFENV